MPITISGGTRPYRAEVDWGDATSESPAVAVDALTLSHVYRTAGIYQVTVRAYDAAGHEAALSLVTVVVGGGNGAFFGPTRPSLADGALLVLWPLIIATGLITMSFWLGEQHRLAMLRGNGQLQAVPVRY